jgi:hypothetical protein
VTGTQPDGAITVTARFMPLSFFFLFVKPNFELDGQPAIPGTGGTNTFPVAPGPHRVCMYTPYLLPARVGPAEVVVDVPPGQNVHMEYKAPLIVWAKGSLGPPPQRYNGLWFYWALLAIVVLVIICCGGTVLLSNNN